MKQGLTNGKSTTLQTTVTERMFASFEGNVVHPTYSTVAMVYHMEWASRQLLVPYLQDDEEGMGAEVTVKHIKPSSIGSSLSITATAIEVNSTSLITEVVVSSQKGIVGHGKVTQVILPKEKINKILKDY